jgi:hypothetical protein
VRNDCTVVMLSERNEADDEEAIRRRNRSCVSGVGVAQPRSESELSRKSVVPLQVMSLVANFDQTCDRSMAWEIVVQFFRAKM